jgi:hypothetical protein
MGLDLSFTLLQTAFESMLLRDSGEVLPAAYQEY